MSPPIAIGANQLSYRPCSQTVAAKADAKIHIYRQKAMKLPDFSLACTQ
jgi:hypothetical protein